MEQKLIGIKDLGLAAALASSGYKICETQRDAAGRSYFTFRASPELDEAIQNYWADSLEVKARNYSDNIKMLKSRIYGER